MKILAFTLFALLASPAAAQDMVGVSWGGTVYSLDSGSGTGSGLGHCGFGQINNMAKSPSGQLVAASGYGVPNTLVDINPTTGAGTAIVTTSLSSIRGMAFLGSTLYAINDSSGTGIGLDDLYSVDLVTGAATYIGSTGYYGVQGLTAANGKLYAWEMGSGNCVGAGLVEVSTTTGLATVVNPGMGNQVCDVQTLCTSPSGAVYAAQGSLYKVDLVTGALTLIGSGGYSDLRGAEFTAGGAPVFTLSSTGSCPGPMTLSTSNGTAGGNVVLLYGPPGSYTRGSGPCAGLTLAISNPTVRLILGADASGSTSLPFNAKPAWCGVTVQAVDFSSCTASNALVL